MSQSSFYEFSVVSTGFETIESEKQSISSLGGNKSGSIGDTIGKIMRIQ